MGKSGIHINPKNKGKFNATKKATGKSTEELTHSSNPVTKKRAIFAQNASHWDHAQNGVGLPTAYSSAPRPISGFHPIQPELQQNPMYAYQEQQDLSSPAYQPIDDGNNMGIVGRNSPDTNTGPYNQQIHGNHQKQGYDGRYGNAALTGLLAIDALIPDRKQPSFVNRPGLSYNEHPYGTGSGALAEHGMTVSNTGYKSNSPDRFNPSLRIPSNKITMKGVNHPVLGVDNYGNSQMMHPGEEYQYDGEYVDEYPMKAQNGRNLAPQPSYDFGNYQPGYSNEFGDSGVYRGMYNIERQHPGNSEVQINRLQHQVLATDASKLKPLFDKMHIYQAIQNDATNYMTDEQVHNELSTLNVPQDIRRKKMQAGGAVTGNKRQTYASYDQIQKDNDFARDFSRRRGVPNYLAENSVVARNIGDPVVQFIDSKTGKPSQSNQKSNLPSILPSGVNINDVYQTSEGQYGYQDPTYDRFVPVDPSVYNMYGNKKATLPTTPTGNSLAIHENGGELKRLRVSAVGNAVKGYYEKGGIYDIDDNTIKELAKNGYKMKFYK